ncbi:hypothetical protein J4Q44_G00176160 [Coregonus suidteri]|uniref:Uncharacterized protein n=1 Tax=Coregonus suidteri TaxID=861788 RepID=A0AAN8LNV0_9TELE
MMVTGGREERPPRAAPTEPTDRRETRAEPPTDNWLKGESRKVSQESSRRCQSEIYRNYNYFNSLSRWNKVNDRRCFTLSDA